MKDDDTLTTQAEPEPFETKIMKPKIKGARIRSLMNKHGITLGYFKDKRCIYADNAPAEAIEQVRKALKEGIIA